MKQTAMDQFLSWKSQTEASWKPQSRKYVYNLCLFRKAMSCFKIQRNWVQKEYIYN